MTSVDSYKQPGAQQPGVYGRDCQDSEWSSVDIWNELLVNTYELGSVCIADIFLNRNFIKM